MACRLDTLLRGQYRGAYGAVLALRQPRFRAGGRDRRVHGLGMACRLDTLLRGQYRGAYGAVLALRQPRFRAGGRDRRVDGLGMTQRVARSVAANTRKAFRAGGGNGERAHFLYRPLTGSVYVEKTVRVLAVVIMLVTVRGYAPIIISPLGVVAAALIASRAARQRRTAQQQHRSQ